MNNTEHYIRINARKGVVLATGDNGSNPAILRHFVPALEVLGISGMSFGLDAEGKPINTGDGLKMGVWAGVRAQNYHAPMIHHMGAGGGFNPSIGITPFLLLNKSGKRFTNECVPGQQLENQIELQPDYTAFQIFDDNWRTQQLQYMPANHGTCCYYDNSKPKIMKVIGSICPMKPLLKPLPAASLSRPLHLRAW
jgi:fumarate reductase flavoprotein subunit